MHFRGGGVGHKSTREATNFFKKDRDRLDMRSASSEPTQDIDDEDDEEWDDVNKDSGIDEDAENLNDYGYIREESDSEVEADERADEDAGSDDFGPEDDGGRVDPDMEELGYADL